MNYNKQPTTTAAATNRCTPGWPGGENRGTCGRRHIWDTSMCNNRVARDATAGLHVTLEVLYFWIFGKNSKAKKLQSYYLHQTSDGVNLYLLTTFQLNILLRLKTGTF